jgi:asparagine synthase (glutamine-hydrolysing)
MIRQFPDTSGDPRLWIDAPAGIALAIPGDDESPAALNLIQPLPGNRIMLASGMHGRLDALRARFAAGTSAELLGAAAEAMPPAELALAIEEPVALAIWNGAERTLTISRDRIGHVPVYYGRAGQDLIIASHLAAFEAYPGFHADLDLGAIAGMMRHRSVPLPATVYRDARALFGGTMLTASNGSGPVSTEITRYWSLRDTYRTAIEHRATGSAAELSREMQRLLTNSIDRSLHDAATPVGMFFSAGVDSNLVAAVAASTGRPLYTITTRFDDDQVDEGPGARDVAERLGARHSTLSLSAGDIFGAIERSPHIYGQPHGDQAGLPAILMADALAASTPLVITGDAGNDLLGSDESLTKGFPLLPVYDRVPQPLRKPIAGVTGLAARGVDLIERAVDHLPAGSPATKIRSGGLRRLTETLATTEPEPLYGIRSSHNPTPQRFFAGQIHEVPATYRDSERWLGNGTRYDRWRLVELSHIAIEVEGSKHEGPLTAAGAGYRAVLLESHMLPFGLSLPDAVRHFDGVDRWPSIDIVRRLLNDPSRLPKAGGFGVPVDRWLRGPYREWAETLLSERNLRETGFYDVTMVRREWRHHLSGKHDRRYVLWPILMTLNWIAWRAGRSY